MQALYTYNHLSDPVIREKGNLTVPLVPRQLPSSDAPTLKLVPATPEQARQCWEMNGQEWRGPLTHEAYLRREVHLGSQELSKDGGTTYWVMIDTAEESEDPVILSSCESYRKRALVSRRKKGSDSGDVEIVTTHGVGSVFCRDAFRGQGYAGRMMMEIRKNLETWQQEPGEKSAFNVLYSDIGKRFYAKRGWLPFPSSHVTLPADLNPKASASPEVKPIRAQHIKELCEIDVNQMKESIGNFRDSPAKARVAFLPDTQTMRWIHSREEFIAHELGKSSTVGIKGAMVDGPVGSRVWCIWTRKFSDKPEEATLHVTRIFVESEEGFQSAINQTHGHAQAQQSQKIAACLWAAQVEAAKAGLTRVEIWNPSPDTLEAVKIISPNVEVEHRQEESIASLLWYGPEKGPNDVEWISNEKYGWC